MRYLKEIIKAKRDRKTLPGLFELIKQYRRWNKLKNSRDVFLYALPWIPFWVIDFLDKEMNDEMRVLEYGGGGSTLFFSSRAKELVTIEHNKEWFEGLQREMEKISKIKWYGCFIEPEDAISTENLSISNPDHYFSSDKNYTNKIFKKYASAIDQYPNEYFDVVLVDGRVRPSCLNHSLNKIKKNGLLILDNADRSYYLEQVNNKLGNYKLLLSYFGPTPYISWFTQANIWRRIK